MSSVARSHRLDVPSRPSAANEEERRRRFVAPATDPPAARPAYSPADEPPPEPLARLLVRKGGRLVVVRLEEVDWIEGAGNYVRLHVGERSFLHRRTLGDLASRVDPERFVRIHRSRLVQLDRIDELRPTPSGTYEVRLVDGTELTMSRTYRRQVLRRAGTA